MLSQTVDQTYPHLSAALDGVQRFADTVGKRDERIQHLLGETSKVAGVLGIHGEQLNRLLLNAQTLLSAINQRSQAVDALVGNVTAVATQLQGLINDNPNLNTGPHPGQHDQRRAGQTQGRPDPHRAQNSASSWRRCPRSPPRGRSSRRRS